MSFFISIILNVHSDPCFEDKSSSLTLKDDEISSGTRFRIELYIRRRTARAAVYHNLQRTPMQT